MDGLMKGKRGLIMGVANDHSIAWGIAKKLAEQGAELAFTYQGEAFGRRVKPLAEKLGASLVLPCDVEDSASVDARLRRRSASEWGGLDFVVHAIGFSDKNELKGLYADTSRENFVRTMVISCYSFTEIARQAAALMTDGGSMLTLTYAGSVRVMPNYNVMGVAKAGAGGQRALSRRRLRPARHPRQRDLGRPGAHACRRRHLRCARTCSPTSSATRRCAAPSRIDEVGGSALYLLSDLSSGVTGEIHYVDSGYHIVSMPTLDELKQLRRRPQRERCPDTDPRKIDASRGNAILRRFRARSPRTRGTFCMQAVSNPNRSPVFRLITIASSGARQLHARAVGPEVRFRRRRRRHAGRRRSARSSPRCARWPPAGAALSFFAGVDESADYVFKETHFDKLTGLYARVAMVGKIAEAALATIKTGEPVFLIDIDIDRFKQINDSIGYSQGDELIRAFAERLQGLPAAKTW